MEDDKAKMIEKIDNTTEIKNLLRMKVLLIKKSSFIFSRVELTSRVCLTT